MGTSWAVGDVTAALALFDTRRTLVIAFAAIMFITETHLQCLKSLCIAPRNLDGGGGLLSFSACCPPVEPGAWNTTRYADEDEARRGSCWMDEHYPPPATGRTLAALSWGRVTGGRGRRSACTRQAPS